MVHTTQVCARHAGGAFAPAPGGRDGRTPDRKRSGERVSSSLINSYTITRKYYLYNWLKACAPLQPPQGARP